MQTDVDESPQQLAELGISYQEIWDALVAEYESTLKAAWGLAFLSLSPPGAKIPSTLMHVEDLELRVQLLYLTLKKLSINLTEVIRHVQEFNAKTEKAEYPPDEF